MKNFSVKTADFKSLSISGESPIVQSDLGTAPNQIPLNKDLGSLAYMNAPQIEDLNVDTLELREIAAEMSETAVDVFVYDTRKDSDGGTWRSRTQHTSWYNETLNTATRGSRREFPSVAVIVAETDNLTIYDGDDPGLPMWMVFEVNTSSRDIFMNDSSSTLTSIAALNGRIFAGSTRTSTTGNITGIDFVGDRGGMVYTSSSDLRIYNGGIGQRNDGLDYSYGSSNWFANGPIVNRNVNDVAMTVLPNAPIDDNTGLPVPTIAVATDGGVSVIKDDGSVVDITVNNASYSYAKNVNFTTNNDFITVIGGISSFDYIFVFDGIPDSDNVMTIDSRTGSSQDARSMFRKLREYSGTIFDGFTIGSEGSQNQMIQTIQGDRFACGNDNDGLTIIDDNDLGFKKKNLAYISSTYNTGWMPGDIKLATLSDTKNETVGVDETTELITNGGFDDDSDWTNSTSGGGATSWTIASGVATSSGSAGYMIQAKGTVGTMITITYEVTSYTSGDLFCVFGSGGSGLLVQGSTSLGTHSITGIVTDNSDVGFYSLGTLSIDNASITKTGELITNGTFDNGTEGWTGGNGATIIEDGGKIKITSTTGGNGYAYQQINTIVGRKYIITFDFFAVDGATALAWIGTSAGGGQTLQEGFSGAVDSSRVLEFTATSSIHYIRIGANETAVKSYMFDNISVRLAEDDRSVNDNGLQIFGEITKSPVAPGADLVAYSGFSADNYLMQPYNPDLDFGTGDFCVMGWVNNTGTHNGNIIKRYVAGGGSGLEFYISGGLLNLRMTESDWSASPRCESLSVIPPGTWAHVCGVRRSSVLEVYINGALSNTLSGYDYNLDTATSTSIGGIGNISSSFTGSMALLRISATAPTDVQIAKIYRDEKVLFTDGAQATLYGTSDAVTALAYDDKTELLHVGTSSGRSDFAGLRRINNTTTAVTTSISASNNLIAEQ